jgi:hypothetical protein
MRTALNGIHLFIDNIKSSDSIFLSIRDSGEESRIAQRVTEKEKERGSTLQERRDGVSHKMSR